MPNRHVLSIALLLCLVTAPFTTVRAKDRDFEMIVNHIKREYGGKQQRIFGFSLAKLFVRIAKPAGVKSVDFAVFEDLPDATGKGSSLANALRSNLSQTWQPVVRVYSKRENEQTYIFLRPAKKDIEVLVVSMDQHEATVVKAKVSPDALEKFMNDNDFMADLSANPFSLDDL